MKAKVRGGPQTVTASVSPGAPPVRAGMGENAERYVIEPYVAVEDTDEGATFICRSQGQTTTGNVYNGTAGPQGPEGPTGVGIVSIVLTGGDHSPGTTDTYTITLTNGNTATFTVYNGVDGTDGVGIVSVTQTGGDHSPGTTDTYTITFTNGNTATFTVYNGADGAGRVTSVNGKTGDVTLSASDVGALPSSYTAPVASVNNKTGAVTLTASDVGALPSSYTAPVTSVNSQTGDVTITASDVGAYEKPVGGIPATDLASTYAVSHTAGGAAEQTVGVPYGEVASGSTSTVMTATVPGVWQLKDGVIMVLRNDIATSASGVTLNVNGLGAKPIYMSNADATRVTTQFTSAQTYIFTYNESRVTDGCWDMHVGQVNSNSIGYQVRTNSSAITVKTKCYRYRLLFTSPDGQYYVPANADTQTSAAKTHTVTTEKIDPLGDIRYYGTTTALAAGDLPSKTILWQQYVITLGYSFNGANAALSLTTNKPVYIKCTPNADGSANIDTTTPFVQDLPVSADGKIYIFLGICDAATTVEMQLKHPVYYHDGTNIRQWHGEYPIYSAARGLSF